jgi:phosphomannomutase
MGIEAERVSIAELMADSGVGFGTSGARGLAHAMTDRVCYAYTRGFLQYLRDSDGLRQGCRVAIAGDFRPSTPRIMAAAAMAVRDFGGLPVNCGFIPTPALTLFGIEQGVPSLMVTGSHIPDDRNGIKFNKVSGEVLKQDEAGIRAQQVAIPAGLFDADGASVAAAALPPESGEAHAAYLRRYLDFFPTRCLEGRRIGLYQHSSVAWRLFEEILQGLGAECLRLGYSDSFLPVDTEAVRPEDVALARQWAAQHALDCVVSTDGDGDRPLVSDENGQWLRGDVAGILCARFLGARYPVAPVSCNSALEACGWFQRTGRTRIGSPYVIAAMQAALDAGEKGVVGYEANGGFLIGDPVRKYGRVLAPLPTRDAAIVALAILLLSVEWGLPISGLLQRLPARFTSSDRLKDFPAELSRQRLAALNSGDYAQDREQIESIFAADFGPVAGIDDTDGLRITFAGGEVVHLRPSGNAPELRCYNEAASAARAEQMNRVCLGLLERWRERPANDGRAGSDA